MCRKPRTKGACFAGMMLVAMGGIHAAPLGTAFTYQGHLNEAAAPADGVYDFEFRLYDALTAGAQQGSTVTVPDHPVSGGVFTMQLDFGAGVFDGSARYLQVGVRPGAETGAYSVISLRQELTPTPYALQTRGVFVDHVGNVGIGTTSPGAKLAVEGGFRGGRFTASDAGGIGVFGWASHPTEWNVGGYFGTDSSIGSGVQSLASGQDGIGIHSEASGEGGRSVIAIATHPTGATRAVWGSVSSPDGFAGYFSGGRNYFEGNVGIGTSPTYRLHVWGDDGTYTNLAHMHSPNGSIVFTDASIKFASIVTGVLPQFHLIDQDHHDDRAIIHAQGNAGAVEALWVSTTGKVGIGTPNPTAKLEVKDGPIKATGGLIIQTVDSQAEEDAMTKVTGQIWLRTDIP